MSRVLIVPALIIILFNSHIAYAVPIEQIDSLNLNKQKTHKILLAFDYGFSIPALKNLPNANPFGESFMGLAEYNLTKSAYIFSEFIFSNYKPDKNLVLTNLYGNNHQWSRGSEIIYKNKKPYRVYSYISGLGYRTNDDYKLPAWRIAVGASFSNTFEDELTLISTTDTISISGTSSYSLGLDVMLGFDVPIFSDVCGFFSTININTAIFNSNKNLVVLDKYFTVLGFYFRI